MGAVKDSVPRVAFTGVPGEGSGYSCVSSGIGRGTNPILRSGLGFSIAFQERWPHWSVGISGVGSAGKKVDPAGASRTSSLCGKVEANCSSRTLQAVRMIAGHLPSGSTGIKAPRRRPKSQNSGEVEGCGRRHEFDEGDPDHGLTDIRSLPLLPSQYAFVPPRRDSFPVQKLLSAVVFWNGRLCPVAVSQLAVCSALARNVGFTGLGVTVGVLRPHQFFAEYWCCGEGRG